jgi:methyl-accepting chemotaxis protein
MTSASNTRPGWIARLGVAQQLALAFGGLLLLLAALGGAALWDLKRIDAAAGALAERWVPDLDDVAQARAALLESRDAEVKHGRTADTSYHAEYEDEIATATKAATAAVGRLAARDDGADPALTKRLQAVKATQAAYRDSQQKVIALGRQKQQKDAADLSDGLASMSFDESVAALDALNQAVVAGAHAAGAAADEVYAGARLQVAGFVAAGIVLGLLLSIPIVRSLSRQLGGQPREAAAALAAVASGDLAQPLVVPPGGEASVMGRLRAMQSSLARVVQEVRTNAEAVAGASTEIASGNNDLSQRTEKQAAALQQTATSMQQLGATVGRNADSARQANQLAQGASAVAVRGGAVVGRVVETMRGIEGSSKRIADIIGTIDSIAFQTNILALNAAVEAARAGEQGRGFAVVAGEVRSLAQRSAEAAKEIKGLIGDSVERVGQGTALVDEAGRTMEEIVGAIRRVTDIVGEISSASEEQAAGVAEIGRAIAQMDGTTQQNAALVEQSAAAAESLKAQAQALVRAVAVFRLAAGAAVSVDSVDSSRSAASVSFTAAAPTRPALRPAAATPAFTSAPKPPPARVPAVTATATAPAPAASTAPASSWPAVERRGPDRAKNVVRPAFAASPAAAGAASAPASSVGTAPKAATGTDDDGWETF